MTKQLLSVIVPVYNESANVPLIYKALALEAHKLHGYTFEFIFVDDGSSDHSLDILNALATRDKRLRVLEFARNFGKEAAASAGLHAAGGDAAIILDADLQHPPSLLEKFIAKWQQGADVVVGVREYDQSESWCKRVSSALYYRIMELISHTKITPHATDYRLIDRCVIDAFKAMNEHNRMTRGLIDWLGFRRDYIHFHAPARKNGQRAYGYRKLINLAMNSFMAYSLVPLKLAGYLGGIILVIAGPLGIFVVVEKYMMGDVLNLKITGTATLAILLLFLVGIVLVSLGLVALYIAHIHAEVMNRPLYVVRRDFGGIIEEAE